MREEYSYKDALTHHHSSQRKFDYFFLGVIIAALSLSIQSFDSSVEYNNTFLIIISWIFFLVSFLAGFFRQERLNLYYVIEAVRMSEQKTKYDIENAIKYEEQKEKFKNRLTEITNIIRIYDSLSESYEKHTNLAYQIQKWSFFYASFFYILFKISNILSICLIYLGLITFIIILINIVSVKTYHSFLKSRLVRSDVKKKV